MVRGEQRTVTYVIEGDKELLVRLASHADFRRVEFGDDVDLDEVLALIEG